MILKLYFNLLILVSVPAYIVSFIFLGLNKSEVSANGFLYAVLLNTTQALILPLEYYQVLFMVLEASITEIQLRQKYIIQVFYYFFFTISAVLNNFPLYIISFLLFLIHGVFYGFSNELYIINILNFVVFVLWILFLVEISDV